jgi:enoyl-CoA hydratase
MTLWLISKGGLEVDLEHVLFEKKGSIAYVILNRPKVFNALNASTITELQSVFLDCARDPEVRVVIVTGAGDKAFAAGADIGELAQLNPLTALKAMEHGQHTYRTLEMMGKPSIAAVNGVALGGGCELAMACTVRIASERAKLGQPEVNLGVIPGYAGTQRLPRIVGKGVALDLIVSGRVIDANEAFRIGLVSNVVPHEKLMEAADNYAGLLLEKGPLAMKAAMEAVHAGFEMSFNDACRHEAALFSMLCSTEDTKEGLGAFLEKRKPQFKGQ